MPRKSTRFGTEGTFAYVLREFERSPACTSKAEGTQANRRYIIKWLEAVLGKYSTFDTVNGIRPKLVQRALDTLADRPAQQANVRALLVTIDKWAAPRELLLRSITFGVQIVGHDGGHLPWTDAQVALGQAHAGPPFPRVIPLMAHLGQRGSDIVRMRLNDITEERHPLTDRMIPGINVVQRKTGLRLWVPFTDELAALIDEWRSDIRNAGAPWLLVRKPTGEPYARKQLTVAWDTERNKNEFLSSLKTAGLVLHGLRGTCVVRLRKAGATVPQICSMIGMSPAMVGRYSRFADQVDMALAAVHHLDFGTARERSASQKTGKAG